MTIVYEVINDHLEAKVRPVSSYRDTHWEDDNVLAVFSDEHDATMWARVWTETGDPNSFLEQALNEAKEYA